MESAWQIEIVDEKRQLAIATIAKEAAELVHCAAEAQEEVAEIEQALATNEHVRMFTGVPDSLLKSFCAYVTDTCGDNHVIAANDGAAYGLCGAEKFLGDFMLMVS